jgi:hypothetical protein
MLGDQLIGDEAVGHRRRGRRPLVGRARRLDWLSTVRSKAGSLVKSRSSLSG